jgi:general secretion pathway protein B
MSYILQALRKSEQERELAAQDSDVINESSTTSASFNRQFDRLIADSSVNSQSEKSIPVVVYGWLGALCVLILFIAGYLYPKAISPQAESLVVEQERISGSVVREITVEEIEVKKATVKKVLVQEKIIPEVLISEPSPQFITPKIAVELAAKDTQSLIPNINISSHIFSSLPARRSIVVNGERLAETDFITPNVQVKEITHQGMIIEVDGLSLVIDRSRGWSR